MHIVVGVDGSCSAVQATRWAAREAARRDVDLRLVHVRQLPLLLPPTDLYTWELTDQGNKWLGAARDAAVSVAPAVDLHTQLCTGQPGEELVAESEDAELVVVGSRGLGGFPQPAPRLGGQRPHRARPLSGGGAPRPGAGRRVARPRPDRRRRRQHAVAVEFALAAAAAQDTEVIAVHAWTYEGLVDAWSPVPLTSERSLRSEHRDRWDEIAAAQHRMCDEQLATLRRTHPDVPVRCVHFRGRPVDGILEQAEHARLVVVGANGRHPAMAGAVGSTSYAVLHHATCPVAVVRTAARPT